MPRPDLEEPDTDTEAGIITRERPPGAFHPSMPPPVSPSAGSGGAHRYAPGRILGKGSMGDVVLSRDGRIGREVALKRMAARYQGDGTARARFLREARVQG